MGPALASTRSCRRACGTVTSNTDSPRIPHDKVTKMTDSCHKTLSEGHHHPPAERFKSSLGHVLARPSDKVYHLVRGPFSCPHAVAGVGLSLIHISEPTRR